MKTTCSLLLATLSLAANARAASSSPSDIKGYAPVSVSSANYRNTPREELYQAVEHQKALNPELPALKTATAPQYFVFIPGEKFEPDFDYDGLTAMLTPALAKKGFINAADAKGTIREPDKVTLMLRITYGTRPWRLPTVRSENLTWFDGMIARPRGKGLFSGGGEAAWDARAGGNDDALNAMAANDANPNSFSFGAGGGGGSAPSGGPNGLTAPMSTTVGGTRVEYGSTREFNLIVIDAFDYKELKTEGKSAKRVWSTFVAAPVQGKEKFSDMVGTLIRNATPYFGETSPGLQVYSDARAAVKIGDLTEVRDEPKK